MPTLPERTYLAPPAQSFWRWDADGSVVEWGDGKTIAFRAELEEVLQRLAPAGLPPLAPVLLLLAACRETWWESSGHLSRLAGLLTSLERSGLPDWISEVYEGLDRVYKAHHELRGQPRVKAELVAAVLETARRRTSASDTQSILRALADGLPSDVIAPRVFPGGVLSWLMADLECLRTGLQRFDAEGFLLRWRTGLEQVVRPAEVEMPPAQRARALLEELADDEELSGLVRMARRLMAVVSLPRPMAQHEELPVGGVSDIANRGPLDRLLLSELAHDELTLSVRVALNEAMYLRRETPPRNPPRQRAVLLDAGLRVWGVPRVFATAVALALTATSDRHVAVHAFRARGRGVTAVDLTSRQGLIEHLEVLDHAVQPGDALPAFVEAIGRCAAGKKGTVPICRNGPTSLRPVPGASHKWGLSPFSPTDSVILTGDDVLADRRFQQALASVELPSLYVGTVNRAGQFRLVARGLRGSKVVRQAHLKLEELLAPRPRPSAPLVTPLGSAALPAILSVKPFPLLLPMPVEPDRVWMVEPRALGVTQDRRLLLRNSPDHGGSQLSEDAPPGTVRRSGTSKGDAKTWAIVAPDNWQSIHLVEVNLPTEEHRVVALAANAGAPRAVAAHGGVILLVYPYRVEVFEMTAGRRIHRLALPGGMTHVRDRFFYSDRHEWYVLAYNGISAALELAVDSETQRRVRLTSLFESAGTEGLIGVTTEGHLYFTASGQLRKVAHGLTDKVQVLAIAPDGRQLAIGDRPDDRSRRRVITVESGRVEPGWQLPWDRRGVNLGSLRPTRRKFFAVAVVEDSLALRSRRGHPWRIQLDRQGGRLWLERVTRTAGSPLRWLSLDDAASPRGTHYLLEAAAWPDGSRAVLDARGLLHLRSSDSSIPELTLVLHEPNLAGWCADGRVFGPEYFTGRQATATAQQIYADVLKRFVERLP